MTFAANKDDFLGTDLTLCISTYSSVRMLTQMGIVKLKWRN